MNIQLAAHALHAGILCIPGIIVGAFLKAAVFRPMGISPRHRLVEGATGILWAAAGWRWAGMTHGTYVNIAIGLVELAFLSSLVVIFLVDWKRMIIPDETSLGGLAASLLLSPLLPHLHYADSGIAFAARHPFLNVLLGDAPAWLRGVSASCAGALAGLLFSLFVYTLGNAAFNRRIEKARKNNPEIDSALGLGDVKLMAFFGAFLGWRAVFVIFLVGSIVGAATGIVIKLRRGDSAGGHGWRGMRNRWNSGSSVLPFGPFLAAGALAAFFMH